MNAGVGAFVGEPIELVLEWVRDAGQRAELDLADLERRLTDAIRKSDERLESEIRQVLSKDVARVEALALQRLAEAEQKERAGREAMERARDVEARAEQRLRDAVHKHLKGVVGPAGRERPLGEVLGARFDHARTFRREVPAEALYVVGAWAYWVGGSEEHRLGNVLSVEEADVHADTVIAVVTGAVDDGPACVGVAHGCSMYQSARSAKEFGDRVKRFVKVWPGRQTIAQATEYCRFSLDAFRDAGTGIEDWLTDRSLTLVRRRENVWVLDITGGAAVGRWTDRLTDIHAQLKAAGVSVTKSVRRRADDSDTDAHGEGFYLLASALSLPGATGSAAPSSPPSAA